MILPIRHNLEQAFVEYISTLDNNANPRINAEHFLNNVIQGLLDNSNNIVGPGGPDLVDTSGNTYELATVAGFSSGSGSELDDMPELEAHVR